MTSNEYQEKALRTEAPAPENLTRKQIRLVHAALGLSSEVGELADALKKHLFYGEELDEVNILEECGDICWYLPIIFDCLGFEFEEVLIRNISKLSSRYPEKFSSEQALEENRNRDKKKRILEDQKCEKCDESGEIYIDGISYSCLCEAGLGLGKVPLPEKTRLQALSASESSKLSNWSEVRDQARKRVENSNSGWQCAEQLADMMNGQDRTNALKTIKRMKENAKD